MNNKICVGYLTNIRDMFVIGSERCEGKALEYQQNFINALNYAIELINNTERQNGKWIFHKDYNESCRYGCNQCGNLNNIPSNFCPNCGAKMERQLP